MIEWIGPIIGTFNEKIILTDELYKFGVARGNLRQNNAEIRGKKTKGLTIKEERTNHVLGALCEIAAALILGGYLYAVEGVVTDDLGYDLRLKDGRKVEVKGKNRIGSYLLIPEKGDITQCDLLCLVTQFDKEKEFRFRGWVTLQEFTDNHKDLGPNSSPRMGRVCTGMDEGELNRLSTLEIPRCSDLSSRIYLGFGHENFPIEGVDR